MRPLLNEKIKPADFKNFYYLKEELTDFCKLIRIPATGNKQEITERIFHYLQTGEIIQPAVNKKRPQHPTKITRETVIEKNLVCSEVHRAFFTQEIGKSFKFKVAFQDWLKNNHGKLYSEALAVYPELAHKQPEKIAPQFEYNTYIKDFFSNNPDLTLADAIQCWNHKKRLPGHNKYEVQDLELE